MSKTFKLSGIILFSVMGLQIMRIISSLLPLSDNIAGWLFSFIMQGLFLGLFPFLLYKATIKDGDFLKDVRLKTKTHPLSYLLALPIGLFTYVVNMGASYLWYVIMSTFGFTYVTSGGTLFTSPEVLILEIITGCILPAVFEEITDRGLLLATLDDVKSDVVKVVCLGLFFGACHQNAPQLGPTALAGVIIGFMAVKGGSIIPGMIVHFMNNFLITIGSYCDQKGISLGILSQIKDFIYSNVLTLVLASAISGILIVLLLNLYMKINKKDEFSKPKNDVEETLFSVYGIPSYDKNGMPIYYTNGKNQTELPLAKPKISDYTLLIVAFISALAVTAFTFVWGLLR
ncbi:MAG: CPBP family intramembrane metalloprotease [Clostridia bacterium]|nr:CPBP family intramembrane metalloprotease [Clostridia bacterium]